MRPTLRPPSRPGFWWSPFDLPMVLAIAALTAWAWPRVGPVAGLFPVVVGHYLLFCNVVRLRPRREALWAVAFLWIAAVFTACGVLHWAPIALAVLPLTLALVVEEVLSANYRGVGARG